MFRVAFVNIGVSNCDMGTSWLLPRLIGASRSHELMLTGRRVDAEEALRIGLVADVVAQDALAARALEAAGQIAELAPWGVQLTKQGMWAALEIPSEQAAIEYEDRQQIMATFGTAPPEAIARVPREAPGGVRRLMRRAVRRRGQDRARDRRLARDRADDRARPRRGGRERDRLLAQAGRRRGRRRGARAAGLPARRSSATSRRPRAPASWRARRASASRRSTSSSTTPARCGARRSRSSRRAAGTARCTPTSRACSTSRSGCSMRCARARQPRTPRA